MQRIKGLRAIEPLGGDITLAQRRHPQVDERLGKVGAAKTAYVKRRQAPSSAQLS
jgi:hypothetical protein